MHPRLASLPGAVPGAVSRGSGRRLAWEGPPRPAPLPNFPALGYETLHRNNSQRLQFPAALGRPQRRLFYLAGL